MVAVAVECNNNEDAESFVEYFTKELMDTEHEVEDAWTVGKYAMFIPQTTTYDQLATLLDSKGGYYVK